MFAILKVFNLTCKGEQVSTCWSTCFQLDRRAGHTAALPAGGSHTEVILGATRQVQHFTAGGACRGGAVELVVSVANRRDGVALRPTASIP